MRWLIIIIVAVAIGAVVGLFVASSPLLESEDHGPFIVSVIISILAMGVCVCAAVLLLRSANRRVAYLSVLPCIILGGILGVFASILLLGILYADIDNIHMQVGTVLGAFIGGTLAIIRVRRRPRTPTDKALAELLTSLPENAGNLIRQIITKMRYRKNVQDEVMAELAAHFEDELRDCKSDEERSQKTENLISDFGDAKLLGILLRRAKKRCRPLWRTMVARTFQAIGILILLFIVYVAWFLTGKPLISVNYLAQLNQMVRPAADDSLNAAPLYDKATDIYGTVSDDILLFFAENYKTIGALQYGGRFRPTSAPNDHKLADEIGVFFANRGRIDRHIGRSYVESEITWRIDLLLRLRYLETTIAERQFIDKWIEDRKEALDLVLAGTQKPYCWHKYRTKQNTSEMMSILVPDLVTYRKFASALGWCARLSAEQGRYADALSDIKSCYRLGQHTRGDNTLLIEQLTAIAIESLAAQTLLDILSEYEIDTIELTKLQRQFEQILAAEDFAMSFEADRLFIYDAIQRCFTQDRFGGGHISPGQFKQLMRWARGLSPGDHYSFLEHIIEKKAWTAPLHALFTHPNKQETFRAAKELYDYWESLNLKTPAQIAAEGIDVEKETAEFIKANMLLDLITGNFNRVIERGHEIKTEIQAIVTVLGLLRYRNDKGFYPENLTELISNGYVSQLPMDPWSDKPLVYKRTDDSFMLYGIAENFTDDDGKVIRDEKGRIRTWTREGDAVFWPVPKPETPEERQKRLELVQPWLKQR